MSDISRSPEFGELVAALALAQREFQPILKGNENPAFRGSKYADLATVIEATRKPLADNGLAIIQLVSTSMVEESRTVTITTMMAHKSGQFITNELILPATMRNEFSAQTIGSAITYGRRYSWQAITGTAAEVDDDGNSASDQGSKEAAQAVAQRKIAEHASKAKESPKSPESTPKATSTSSEETTEIISGPIGAVTSKDAKGNMRKTSAGSPYISLFVEGQNIPMYDNFKRPIDTKKGMQSTVASIFDILANAEPETFVKLVVSTKIVEGVKKKKVIDVVSIGALEWDESGTPVRNINDLPAGPYKATDEDIPEAMR